MEDGGRRTGLGTDGRPRSPTRQAGGQSRVEVAHSWLRNTSPPTCNAQDFIRGMEWSGKEWCSGRTVTVSLVAGALQTAIQLVCDGGLLDTAAGKKKDVLIWFIADWTSMSPRARYST